MSYDKGTTKCPEIMCIPSHVQNELNRKWCQWSKNKMDVFGGVRASPNDSD